MGSTLDLPLLYSGKVRDIYELSDDLWLMVASDRISAFDVVMAETVPHKGAVLTGLTRFWLEMFKDEVPNHLVGTDPAEFGVTGHPELAGRSMVVRKAEMLSIECIVRGYVSGSAWKEYRQSGTIHGEPAEPGLVESARLARPRFTPSTKAATGHDENITFDQAADLVGKETARRAGELSVRLYEQAAGYALERGIIIADTKFEFGFIDGELALCDEVLTPDSSRFWWLKDYQPGTTPVSLDKQPVRDWLDATPWDKTPPPPTLPEKVIADTCDRYLTAFRQLTGVDLVRSGPDGSQS
jgi:phosphoribosylaminoimidazole-succinocarboxamide synthase